MNELGSEARALLKAARQGDEPRQVHRARVRARLAATILAASCAGEVAGATKSASATSAAAGGDSSATTALSTSVVAKAIASVCIVSAVAVGGSRYLHSPRPPAGHPPSLPALGSVQPPIAAHPLEPSAVPRQSSTPTPVRAAAAGHRAAKATDVEAELRILREAHASLHTGDPARALALLDEHERQFPFGALLEERESTRPAVLCAMGRVADARQAAARFLRSYPESPQASRVRSVCATAPASSATF